MKNLLLIPGLILTAVLLLALCAYEFCASLVRTVIFGQSAGEQELDLR